MEEKNNSIIPVIILGCFFFIFGFVTWLNGTLIPYLKIACELNTQQSLLVAFAFYISYFVMALPSSWVLQKIGFKKGMMLGLFVMAAGALIFIPAANTRTYELFLTGLFVIGTGLSLLQTASNPYITIVGPIESAAKRISVMGICSKVAGVLAPIILGAIILSDADTLTTKLTTMNNADRIIQLNELASRVIQPYTFMAIALAVLALLVNFSPLPEIEAKEELISSDTNEMRTSVFQFPNLVFGAIGIFVCVGVEVISGDTIGIYGQSQGIPLSEAKIYTSFTLSAMVIGYIIGILTIPKFLSQQKALAYSAISGVLFSALILFTKGYTSVFFVALLGLSNALMWPAIWPLGIDGLGKFTKTASAILIMGIAGGAFLPQLYGKLADSSLGHQWAYVILFPCYFYILWYATKGYQIKVWQKN